MYRVKFNLKEMARVRNLRLRTGLRGPPIVLLLQIEIEMPEKFILGTDPGRALVVALLSKTT